MMDFSEKKELLSDLIRLKNQFSELENVIRKNIKIGEIPCTIDLLENEKVSEYFLESCLNWHRFLWNWIGFQCLLKKRVVHKHEFFGHFRIPDEFIPELNCYACLYAKSKNKLLIGDGHYCRDCPIKWDEAGSGIYCCESTYSFYIQFTHMEDYLKASELAFKIADSISLK